MKQATLLALIVLAGCESESVEKQAPPPISARSGVADIHFPQYRPPAEGGPEAFMEAGMGGVLALRGGCLGFIGHDGRLQTIVWTPDARLGSDARGPFVAIGGSRFRPGDRLKGGGGTMPSDFSDRPLTRPFPVECDRSRAIQFHSIEHGDWASNPLPPPPPPPPAGSR